MAIRIPRVDLFRKLNPRLELVPSDPVMDALRSVKEQEEIDLNTCMLHRVLSPNPLSIGDLAVINLNPQVEGYCANLSRTFVLGEPDDLQRRLMKAYSEMVAETREMIKPGIPVKDLDARGQEICAAHGFGDYHLDGISHGIGLRFEETPASTIIRQHRNVKIREGMTLTIGHTILSVPGVGGVRNGDVYLVISAGAEILVDYAADWIVPCGG